MKTLKEVIKVFEECSERDGECKGCQFARSQYECSAMQKISADVFVHLNTYKMKKEELNDIANRLNKCLAEYDDNPALTWEELRQFEGGPVYVKLLGTYEGYPNASRWMLVQSDVNFGNVWFIDRSRARYCFYEKDMNDIWQAFRKEK